MHSEQIDGSKNLAPAPKDLPAPVNQIPEDGKIPQAPVIPAQPTEKPNNPAVDQREIKQEPLNIAVTPAAPAAPATTKPAKANGNGTLLTVV